MSYGIAQYAETLSSWMADDVMVKMASVRIGPEAYGEIPDRMLSAPSNLPEAYEQAAYFLALATRRAVALAAEGKLQAGTAESLSKQMNAVVEEGAAATEGTGFVCSTTGYLCPVRGSGKVLRDTIEIIEGSALPAGEKVQMTTALRKNRRAVMLRQAVPWIALLGVGAAVGFYYTRRT